MSQDHARQQAPAADSAASDWMLIGRTAGVFGVHGEIKIEPLTDVEGRFDNLDRVFLGVGHEPRVVERARPHKGQILLKLEGIDTPEQVKALGPIDLFLPRAEIEPLPEGHFYLEDAIGLEVQTTDGENVGTVADILRTGSNDVFVVMGSRGEVLIPVIKDAVEGLDLQGRVVRVEPWALGEE